MNLFRNVLTISGLTAVSRVLGMVREMLMSHVIGASWISDAFVVAFKFPNFFRRFFAEGAFNAAFVPQFAGKLSTDGEKSAFALAQGAFSLMAWFLVAFCAVVIVLAPYIVHVLAPGFATTPERLELAVYFIRITFPYILFISLSALLAGVLNSFNRFAAAAAAPILLNILMIGALLGYDFFDLKPAEALSYSVFFAGIVQFLWMYFTVKRIGFSFLLTIPKLSKDVTTVLKLMIPGAIGAGVTQINLLVDMMLASLLPEGSMSYLYYADRLNQLPLSIFGVAMGTALLPQLSKLIRSEKVEESLKLQTKALTLALQMTIPAAIALMILATPLIGLLFGHGNFSNDDVLRTGPALAAFAIGLPAYVSQKVYTAAFFARQDTSTPVRVGMICVGVNVVLNLALMGPFQHVGMALATSFSAWLNIALLAFILNKRGFFQYTIGFYKTLIQIIALTTVMALAVMAAKDRFIIEDMSLWIEIRNIMFVVSLGLSIYGAGFMLMERRWILKRFKTLV